eukprot:329422-Prymnesium_polylepis.1
MRDAVEVSPLEPRGCRLQLCVALKESDAHATQPPWTVYAELEADVVSADAYLLHCRNGVREAYRSSRTTKRSLIASCSGAASASPLPSPFAIGLYCNAFLLPVERAVALIGVLAQVFARLANTANTTLKQVSANCISCIS